MIQGDRSIKGLGKVSVCELKALVEQPGRVAFVTADKVNKPLFRHVAYDIECIVFAGKIIN